jgi:uncharacterized protein
MDETPSKKTARIKSELKSARPLQQSLLLVLLALFLVAVVAVVATVQLFANHQKPLPSFVGEVCAQAYRSDVVFRLPSGRVLYAEVANTPEQRELGLSGRQCIGDSQALLFVFETNGVYPFWMKDMKFPIDIVWIDGNKKVVHVEHDVQPQSYPKTVTSLTPARYVLEIKSGQVKSTSLTVGDQLAWQ